MKKLLFLFVLLGSQFAELHAFDVRLLANNKESYSRQISQKDWRSMRYWVKNHRLTPNQIKSTAIKVLANTMVEFKNRNAQCDLGLPTLFIRKGISAGLLESSEDFRISFIYLRNKNLIDDIFYKIVTDSQLVNEEMKASKDYGFPSRPFNLYTRKNENIDVAEMYESVNAWPDEIESCSLPGYFRLTNKYKSTSAKDRDGQIRKLNYLALINDVISVPTYHKLDVLRRMGVLNWHVNINGYLEVLENAKDKLAQQTEAASTSSFNDKYVSRKEKITQRGRLYKTFSSTQVMMLAQIIEKMAKRMDSRLVGLNFQYTEDPQGETETYVLSPMEQYRVSIKMLRKDLGELMRSETFRGTGVEYEDLISAAFETGLVRSEELVHILKFEEFWNPKKPKWKAYANFAFGLASTGSYFLPAPFNVLGAIALVLTQTKLMGDKIADPDDNWNAIL